MFNLWMTLGFTSNKKETSAFYASCKTHMKKYDYVILLPWGDFRLEQLPKQATKRKRVMNTWVQFRHHSTIIGIAMQWVPLNRIIVIPNGTGGVEERCSQIVDKLL